MKRFLCVILVLLAAGGLFAKGQADKTAAKAAPVDLIWYVPGGGNFPYPDAAKVYAAFNEMTKKDLNTTVTFKVTGAFGDYNQTMPLALAAGEKFDIVWTSNWSNSYIDGASKGYYAPLDDLLPKYAPSIWKDTKDSLESARYKGKIMGVWSQQIAIVNSSVILRMPMIDKYKWDVSKIKMLQDIEPFLADIKKNEPTLIPLSGRNPAALWAAPYMGIIGPGVLDNILAVRVDDKDCKVFLQPADPEYQTYVKLGRDWFVKGYYAPDGLTYTNDQWAQLWKTGKIAVDLHNGWVPGQEKINEAFGETSLRVPYGKPAQSTTNIINTLNAIGARSAHQVEAVKFLEWLWTNVKGYNTLVWGLEGQHYTKVSENIFNPNPNGGYFTNVPWVYGNTFIGYIRAEQNPETNKLVAEANRSARKATIMGFNIDMGPIKNLVASVSAVQTQYEKPVLTGYQDPDVELPKYIAALKKAGVDELIAAVQAQLDAWKKTKG